jgi:hypothetical protein
MDVAGQHDNVGADNWRHEIAELNMQITQDMCLQKKPPPTATKVSGWALPHSSNRPSIVQFKRGLDKIFDDLSLGNQIHDRQQKKQLVGSAVVGSCWITVLSSVGP